MGKNRRRLIHAALRTGVNKPSSVRFGSGRSVRRILVMIRPQVKDGGLSNIDIESGLTCATGPIDLDKPVPFTVIIT